MIIHLRHLETAVIILLEFTLLGFNKEKSPPFSLHLEDSSLSDWLFPCVYDIPFLYFFYSAFIFLLNMSDWNFTWYYKGCFMYVQTRKKRPTIKHCERKYFIKFILEQLQQYIRVITLQKHTMILNSNKKFHQQKGTGNWKNLNNSSGEMLQLCRKSQRPKKLIVLQQTTKHLTEQNNVLSPLKQSVVK